MNKVSNPTTAQEMRESIENATETAADRLCDGVRAAADEATDRTERQAGRAAEAAAAASEEFHAESPQAQAADRAATSLHDVAEALHSTDFDKVAGRVKEFARENPALFLGGAALLGFAATRFLKSSDPAPARPEVEEDDPWVGHVGAPQKTPSGDPMSRGYSNGTTRS